MCKCFLPRGACPVAQYFPWTFVLLQAFLLLPVKAQLSSNELRISEAGMLIFPRERGTFPE
jgi:hypothetical protein